ncbi:MAG: DUF2283 domain-containing protein [Patescibacteria group bacterium]|jgi:uncharacterized protein YuzE|nr:DUF2283 domain-containing protein [Patescibacteria group bacterium]|tara:strand:+ start:10674 stop:10919 length:246 start_codon:yes stop_codon:yes gene_type:complete
MNISYDNQADAMYIKLKEGNFGINREVSEGVVLDLSDKKELLGIEILDASKRFDLADEFGRITVEMPMGISKGAMPEKVAA